MNTPSNMTKTIRIALTCGILAAIGSANAGQSDDKRRIPAQAMARDASDQPNTIRLDRGFDDGIRPDMPVLAKKGLVGKTLTVGRNFTIVALLTHKDCKVAAQADAAAAQGIVNGIDPAAPGEPELGCAFLPKNSSLRAGQKLYTSGIGGSFPAGILIGTVKSFQIRELDGHAILAPAVDLTALRDVFVLAGDK